MFRRTLILVATFVLVAAAPVAAQDDDGYGPDESFVVDDTTVLPGDVVGVSGTGCPAGSTVTFTIDGEVVGTATADGDGAFDDEVTIPSNLTPGSYQIVATCGDLVQSVTIEVLSAGVDDDDGDDDGAADDGAADDGDDDGAAAGPGDDGGPGGTLARTGSDYMGILVPVGAGLLTIGGLILLSSRKRGGATSTA